MHRISRSDLFHSIYVVIRTAPRLVLNGLRSKLPHDGDKAAGDLATLICNAIDNDSKMVIGTELVDAIGCNGRSGKWGIDESDPTA